MEDTEGARVRERTNRMRERDAGEGDEIGRHKRWEKRETGHTTGTPMAHPQPNTRCYSTPSPRAAKHDARPAL